MRRFAILVCVVAVLAACGGQTAAGDNDPVATRESVAQDLSAPVALPPASPPVLTAAPAPAADGADEIAWEGFNPPGVEDLTLAALTHGEVDVYENRGDSEPSRTLPATTILGTDTVVTAIGHPTEDGWLEVMVPGRPNGGAGWIEVDEVDLYVVTDQIVIDLSDRELVYYSNGTETLRSAVTVGTSHNPTPTGRFFVTDSVRLEGGGPWGPAALGLSARSETITEFNGGDGIIGIHGTNNPGSIGQAASLGCVRLPNDVITELRDLVSLGTPVEIRA